MMPVEAGDGANPPPCSKQEAKRPRGQELRRFSSKNISFDLLISWKAVSD
jgi:hypothetical protein